MRALIISSLILMNTVVFAAEKAEKAEKKETLDATALVKRVEEQQLGKSFRGKLHMTINRPGSVRELDILSWTSERKKSVIKIVNPLKDRGTGNLRVELDLWQYLPKVERLIKIPPSLMLQPWMGSDFTNDDLVKTSSFVRDYTHEFVGYEQMNGKKVAKIVCTPKPKAPVVWGKLEMWIEPTDAAIYREDFISEQGEVVKRLTGSEVKTFGKHTIPSRLEMTTLKKKTSTVLKYEEAVFDEALKDDIFTQNYLKSPVAAQ